MIKTLLYPPSGKNKKLALLLFLFSSAVHSAPKILDSSSENKAGHSFDFITHLQNYHAIDSIVVWLLIIFTLINTLALVIWIRQIKTQKTALKISEERFQLAMKATKEGLWDWNIITNEVYFSPAYAQMLGYKQMELENTEITWKNLLHPEDKKKAINTTKSAISNCSEHYEHEFRLRHKLGHYIHIHSIGSIVSTDKKGKATRAIGTQQDITERKKIQTSLEQHKNALDTSSIVSIVNTQGDITYINNNFKYISGYREEEILGKNHRILDSGTHPKAFWTEMFEQASKGLTWRQEICNKSKEGNLYWLDTTILGQFDSHGKLEQYIAISSDITPQKKTEQKLQKREQQFRSLIHNIPSTFYRYEYAEDWSISFITDAVEPISGRPASDFIDNTCSLTGITHPEDEQEVFLAMMNAVKKHQSYTMEYRIIHQDDSIRWIHEKGTPIYDDNNKPLYLQGALFDITEKKKVEIELVKAKHDAEKANRFKSDFLSNMSHEIRTPMNAIIGLGYLALKTELSSQQREYIKKIQTASHSLLTIINDILDFSKIEAGKMNLESVNFQLDTILENLGDLFRFSSEDKNIELIFDISTQIPTTLIGDPTRLSQILINLCSNAIKFTAQGEIKISVHPLDVLEHKVILKFNVSDTGCGIPTAQQHQLFDSFYQTDTSTTRTHGGTGLGLTICKKLVTLMNGVIGVESIVGQGSNFFFFAEFGLDPGNHKNPHFPHSDLKGLRVLVVDDNETARNTLRDQLASLSFKVTTVASAKKAYSALETAEKNFDLILMDWSMPDINGLEAVKTIKRNIRLKKIPAIIMVTAYAKDEVANEAEAINLDGFIIKPVAPSVLYDAIINAVKPTPIKYNVNAVEEYQALSGSVLIVEDNEINQQVAEELLKTFGLTVDIAVNGLDAVNKVTQHAENNTAFDLVLMDIQMPEMDGLQATQKLRSFSQFKDLPIIAMTAHAMIGDKEKSLAAGMNEHITKPIDPTELYKTLKQWLAGIQTKIEIPAKTSPFKEIDMTILPDYSESLDVEWGLQKIGGNRSLFSKLLKDFHDDHKNDIQLLQNAFDENELEDAMRIIHTIKGVSGNIGARLLQQQSLVLEQCIENKQDFTAELILFNQEFSALMSEIDQFKKHNKIQKTQADQRLLSFSELTVEVKKLYQLLQDGDNDASNQLRHFQGSLSKNVTEKIETLKLAIDDYDFELAISILTKIASQLNIALI